MDFLIFYCQKCYTTILLKRTLRPHGTWYADLFIKNLGIQSCCKEGKWLCPSWEEMGKECPPDSKPNNLWWVELDLPVDKRIDRFDAVICKKIR